MHLAGTGACGQRRGEFSGAGFAVRHADAGGAQRLLGGLARPRRSGGATTRVISTGRSPQFDGRAQGRQGGGADLRVGVVGRLEQGRHGRRSAAARPVRSAAAQLALRLAADGAARSASTSFAGQLLQGHLGRLRHVLVGVRPRSPAASARKRRCPSASARRWPRSALGFGPLLAACSTAGSAAVSPRSARARINSACRSGGARPNSATSASVTSRPGQFAGRRRPMANSALSADCNCSTNSGTPAACRARIAPRVASRTRCLGTSALRTRSYSFAASAGLPSASSLSAQRMQPSATAERTAGGSGRQRLLQRLASPRASADPAQGHGRGRGHFGVGVLQPLRPSRRPPWHRGGRRSN